MSTVTTLPTVLSTSSNPSNPSNPPNPSPQWLAAGSLKALLWNARSLNNKLHFFLISCNQQVIRHNSNYRNLANLKFCPTNYTIYRLDWCSLGGGVLIAVSHNASSLFHASHSAELIVITLHTSPTLYLCCIYAPPSCSLSLFYELKKCLESIPHDSNSIARWSKLTKYKLVYINSLFWTGIFILWYTDRLNLVQLVRSPTRIKGNVLDLITTNSPEMIGDIFVDSSMSKSDHFPVSFSIICNIPPAANKPRVLYNFAGISDYLDDSFI